jgi:hypothetical protein
MVDVVAVVVVDLWFLLLEWRLDCIISIVVDAVVNVSMVVVEVVIVDVPTQRRPQRQLQH